MEKYNNEINRINNIFIELNPFTKWLTRKQYKRDYFWGLPKRTKWKPAENQRVNSCIGGERGIRTPGGVTLNGFQDRRNRPLCHLSLMWNFTGFSRCECKGRRLSPKLQVLGREIINRVFKLRVKGGGLREEVGPLRTLRALTTLRSLRSLTTLTTLGILRSLTTLWLSGCLYR